MFSGSGSLHGILVCDLASELVILFVDKGLELGVSELYLVSHSDEGASGTIYVSLLCCATFDAVNQAFEVEGVASAAYPFIVESAAILLHELFVTFRSDAM